MTTLELYLPTHHYSPLLTTTHHHYLPTQFPPPQSALLFHFHFFLSNFQPGSEKEQASSEQMSSVKVSLFHLTTRLQLLTIFTMTTLGFYLPTHQYSPLLATTPLPLLANLVSTSLISAFISFFFFLTSLFTHLLFFLASSRRLTLVRSLMPSCPLA